MLCYPLDTSIDDESKVKSFLGRGPITQEVFAIRRYSEGFAHSWKPAKVLSSVLGE